MPAYFETEFRFSRKDIYPEFMRDFYDALDRAGVSFLSGCWEEKDLAEESIIEWNQKRLEEDFHLGFDEHYSHDYKQTMFTVSGFEYIRGFWMNDHPEKGMFVFFLITPEAEITSDGEEFIQGSFYSREKITLFENVCAALWNEFPLIKSIHTGLEVCGGGGFPFEVIPEEVFTEEKYEHFRHIGRDGVLVYDSSQFGLIK